MRRACRRVATVSWLAAAVTCSLALQRPAVGQAAPLPEVRDLQGLARTLKDFAGPKGLVVFFWASWSERSVEELKRLDAEQTTFREHGIGIVAVNVEHQAMNETALGPVTERVSALGITLPVIVDDGLTLFKAYGVVSVPSTALVDAKGRLASFFSGYAAGQREEIFDAIERLAGIEHEKAVVDVPRGSAPAVRRFEMGRRQLAGGRFAAARASFQAAADADAAFADPLVELAALALDSGDRATATPLLEKALTREPGHQRAALEQARLLFGEGKLDESRALLSKLANPAQKDPLVFAYFALVLQSAGQADEARSAFGRARALGIPDLPDTVPAGDATAVLDAMKSVRLAEAARQ